MLGAAAGLRSSPTRACRLGRNDTRGRADGGGTTDPGWRGRFNRGVRDSIDRRTRLGRFAARRRRSVSSPLTLLAVMNHTPISMRNPLKAAFFAWLIPGWGHFYQGRKGQGVPLLLSASWGCISFGLVMGEGKIVYWRWVNPFHNPEKFCVHYLGQFFVGLASLPALDPGDASVLWLVARFWGNSRRAVARRLERTSSSAGQARRNRHDLHHGRRLAQHPGHLRRVRRAGLSRRRRRGSRSSPARRPRRRGRAEGGGLGMIGASSVQVYWLVLPLVAVISLVYAASRHESWPRSGHARFA